jgi:gluconate 2-dehydrogenase gamma chain
MNRRIALQAIAAAPALAHLSAAESPRFFSVHEFTLLRSLCQSIIPSDRESGGAIEAKAPELIDLLASENSRYAAQLRDGFQWLDETCRRQFSAAYLDCGEAHQKEMLDRMAYRENEPAAATAFFALLRDLTLAGYFTSEIGIMYLGYQGNHYLSEFPGCPPLPL